MQSPVLEADDMAADAEAQFQLAYAVYSRAVETVKPDWDNVGSELEQHADFVEAARCCKLAADQGHLGALIALSTSYNGGIGVPKNYEESMRLLALAAGQKQLNQELSAMEKFRLSHMYSNGWQVRIDQVEALRLMKLAAEENLPFAMYLLATNYDGCTASDIGLWNWNGLQGGKRDLNEAVRLYKLAIIHSTGDQFFTSNDDDKRYYVLPDSQYRLALLLQDGNRGVQPDLPEAARLFKLAGEAGIPSASFSLAIMHHQGQGVPRNFEEAARLYKLVADQGDVKGNVTAHGMLSSLYASGQGVQQDHVESARLIKIAATKGDVRAQISLGDAYEKGEGVLQDLAEAARWYSAAAEQVTLAPRDAVILGFPSNPVARAKLAALQLKVAESQFVASVAVAPACDLVSGTRVCIEGLQSRPEMNGQMGVILGKQITWIPVKCLLMFFC
jgi:TPR repeat protein